MIKDLILKNRSYRRFDESVSIDLSTLKELVDLGRCSASGANKQPLKYLLSADQNKNDLIFPNLFWAGALKDWDGPKEGERPTGYIIILLDKDISANPGVDQGIAAQSILLGATEMGFGGCMMGAINRDGLREALDIPTQYDILLTIAIGKPNEKIVFEEVGKDNATDYWRDEETTHHLPKRTLEDIII